MVSKLGHSRGFELNITVKKHLIITHSKYDHFFSACCSPLNISYARQMISFYKDLG
jgi:hypothetical protein